MKKQHIDHVERNSQKDVIIRVLKMLKLLFVIVIPIIATKTTNANATLRLPPRLLQPPVLQPH